METKSFSYKGFDIQIDMDEPIPELNEDRYCYLVQDEENLVLESGGGFGCIEEAEEAAMEIADNLNSIRDFDSKDVLVSIRKEDKKGENVMTTIDKITNGFVSQTFDEEGNCIGQEFIVTDESEYVDDFGEKIESDKYPKNFLESLYHPLEMKEIEIVDPDIATGFIVSAWGKITISLEATLNVKTGKIKTKQNSVEIDGLDSLDEEFFEADKDQREKFSLHEKLPVCGYCHDYIIDDEGKCLNPDCE